MTLDEELHQGAIDNFLPDPAKNFSNAIVIVIEMVIRINQTLMKIFLSGS
jgi:hypothetical protein